MNAEMVYSSNDYGEFNKIIQTNSKEEKTTKNQNKKVKIIDYGKLKEREKKLKNKDKEIEDLMYLKDSQHHG